MDLHKTKIYLDKLNREFARMSNDPENIMRIDMDIMLSYVRELYDGLLSDPEMVNTPVVVRAETPARKSAPPPVAEQAPSPPAAPEPPSSPTPPSQAAEPAPPPEEKPAPAQHQIAAEPIKIAIDPVPAPKPISFPAIPPDAEALFEQKQVTELSEKLSELPIPDLRKAIALNDRLLLTRELFGGDGLAFDNAITALNNYAGFEQAKHYLLDQCVMRYRWTDKKHVETARNFIKLVRRRYN